MKISRNNKNQSLGSLKLGAILLSLGVLLKMSLQVDQKYKPQSNTTNNDQSKSVVPQMM